MRQFDLHVSRVLVVAVCVTMALAGCGGRASVQGSFSGAQAGVPSASASATSTPGAGQGATVSVGRGLGLAIVVGLIVADVVHWTATKLEEAFAEQAETRDTRRLPVQD